MATVTVTEHLKKSEAFNYTVNGEERTVGIEDIQYWGRTRLVECTDVQIGLFLLWRKHSGEEAPTNLVGKSVTIDLS